MSIREAFKKQRARSPWMDWFDRNGLVRWILVTVRIPIAHHNRWCTLSAVKIKTW